MIIFVVKIRLIIFLKFYLVFKIGKKKLSWIKKKYVKDLRIWYGVYFLFMYVIKMKWLIFYDI